MHSECVKNEYSSCSAYPTSIPMILSALLLCQEGQIPLPGLSCVETEDNKCPAEALEWLGGLATFSCKCHSLPSLCTAAPGAQLANPSQSLQKINVLWPNSGLFQCCSDFCADVWVQEQELLRGTGGTLSQPPGRFSELSLKGPWHFGKTPREAARVWRVQHCVLNSAHCPPSPNCVNEAKTPCPSQREEELPSPLPCAASVKASQGNGLSQAGAATPPKLCHLPPLHLPQSREQAT